MSRFQPMATFKKALGCLAAGALELALPATIFAGMATNDARDFGFGPLEIYKFDSGTTRLTVCDVNGDKRDDIVFANNTASRLEVLLRKPAPAVGQAQCLALDEQFDNKGFVVDQKIIAYELTDLNGDKKPDLLVLGREQGLELRLQSKDGGFMAPVRIYLAQLDKVVSLRTGDLNEDGRTDAIVCRRDNAEILWNAGDGAFGSRTELAFGCSQGGGLDVADFNGDGHLDVMFYFSEGELPLRFRPGNGKGGFGLESLMPLAAVRDVHKLDLAGQTTSALGSIPQSGRVFRMHAIVAKPLADFLGQDETMPQRLPLKGLGQKNAPAWLVADFNQDGYEDFCVAAPELSQIHLYAGTAQGLNPEPQVIDSLSGVTAMSLAGERGVLVFSPSEKTAALHENLASGKFPRLLSVPEKLVMATALPWDNCYVCLARNDTAGQMNLSIVSLADNTNQPLRSLALAMPNDPECVRIFKMDTPDTWGLLCIIPYQPPELFVFKGTQPTKLSPAAFNALSQPASASAFAIPNAPDGQSLIVAQNQVVRAYRWQASAYEAVQQFNPGNENAKITACAKFKVGKNDGMLMYDQNSGNMFWQSMTGQTDRRKTHLACPLPDLAGMVQLQSKDKDRSTLLLIGRAELFVLRNGAKPYAIEDSKEYASPAENPSLAHFNPVRVGKVRRPMVAILDTRNRSVELVSFKEQGWQKELIFEVFLDAGFTASGKSAADNEPHDVASGDIDGDGCQDLVVLVHDKLIVYPGE